MNGPPEETCVQMLARHQAEIDAYLLLLARNQLEDVAPPSSMIEEREILESAREAW